MDGDALSVSWPFPSQACGEERPGSKVAVFVAKKKGSLCQKAARNAGCSKLVRKIYAMLINGAVYSDND
jgi:hypothetical protein